MERTHMRHGIRLVGFAAIVAAAVSCGDVVRQGRSPVYLVIDSLAARQGRAAATFSNTLNSDVLTIVLQPQPCSAQNPCPTIFNDIGSVILRSELKNIARRPVPRRRPLTTT